MDHIVQYIFNALKNGELSEQDSLHDDGASDGFVYYDGDGEQFFRITVSRATVEIAK
jgi:hypothetical protein